MRETVERAKMAVMAVVVVVVLLALPLPTRGQDLSSECWSSLKGEEEAPSPPPSQRDLNNMGVFVAQFVKVIGVTEVYLCVTEESGLKNKTTERTLAVALARRSVFFMPCDLDKMRSVLQAIVKGTTYSSRTPTALQHPAALHITSRSALATTLGKLHGTLSGWGIPTGQHILLGVDLPNCDVFLENVTSHWYQASYRMESGTVAAEEVFLFGDGREALKVPVASWSATRGLTILYQPGIGPSDFQGHAVNVVTIIDRPLVMKMRVCRTNTSRPSSSSSFMDRHTCSKHFLRMEGQFGTGNQTVITGYLVEVLLSLAKSFNFTVRLSTLPPDDAVFGTEMKDGNYNGLIGALQRKQADIALAAFSITDERLKVVDFSEVIGYSGMNIYAQRNSSLESIGWDTFVRSFHWETWLAILTLLGVMTVGLWVIVRQQANEDQHFAKGSNVAFILFSCLVQQGSWILPTTGRAQAVLWLFWFTSVVLYASYTAILTSFLTVSTVTPPFSTLQEAVKAPGWKIGMLKGTATPKILQRSKKEGYQKVYEGLVRDPSLFCDSREAGLDRIMSDSKFSFMADRDAMSYLIRGNCSVKEMTENFLAGFSHMGYRKHLPYAEVINRGLVKLESGGVMDRIHQQWWGKPIPCEAQSPFTRLGFSNILTAFMLLLAGIIVSSAIFALEILYTSQRPPTLAPPQITYDKIEFFSSHQPLKQDNGMQFMKTGGKGSEPLRWSSMEPWKMRASNRRRL